MELPTDDLQPAPKVVLPPKDVAPMWLKIFRIVQIAIPIGLETIRIVKELRSNTPPSSDGFKVNELSEGP